MIETKTTKISVIIPVYNAAQHLAQCLDSVLNQELKELEVLCVDDGSNDESPAILDSYAARDSRVRVFRQENQYAGTARNRGMTVARGEYLAFLDADDYYLPGALSGLYRLAQRHDLDMVKGRFFLLNSHTGMQSRTAFSRSDGVPYGRVITLRDCPERLLNGADVPWNGLYRRAFTERWNICFNHLRCVNDRSFYIHCLLKAGRIMYTRQEVACYRVAQADSLIGRKARYFQAQLDSYTIIRELCRSNAPSMLTTVLRQELIGLLGWYERLRDQAPDPAFLDDQVGEFLKNYDESDVGENFLQEFPYSSTYFHIRYGMESPGRRSNLLVRMVRCQKEHGWRYTLAQLLTKLYRKNFFNFIYGRGRAERE